MRRAVALVCAIVFAGLGTFAGTAEAHARVMGTPTCLRVPLGGGDYRLYVDPGNVVAGRVQSVRAFETQLNRRNGGVWSGRVTYPYEGRSKLWHVVIKSDAQLFSDRRWSGWVGCKKVELG